MAWTRMVLKDKMRHIKHFKRVLGAKNDSNWAGPSQKSLEAFHQQELGKDFYREKAEAKQGNY